MLFKSTMLHLFKMVRTRICYSSGSVNMKNSFVSKQHIHPKSINVHQNNYKIFSKANVTYLYTEPKTSIQRKGNRSKIVLLDTQ